MQKRGITRAVLALAVLIVAIGLVMHFTDRHRPGPAASDESDNPASAKPESHSGPARSEPMAANEPSAKSEEDEGEGPTLPRDKVEAYLLARKRSASSLLAALHAMNDTNYLLEAATNFPNDPQVQLTILSRNIFPEQRRKWLDAFKASSPDNSLANFLSARDLFDNGQTNAAVNEIMEATGKAGFKDYAMEAHLDEEELHLATGESALEAAHAHGWAEELLPMLASFKGTAQGVGAVQKQYLEAGDVASAENLARAGLSMADRLREGEGGKILISRMVGNSMEAITLSQLDQNTSYEFLGGKTPKEKLEEMKQTRAALKQLIVNNSAAYESMTEPEMLMYSQRMKIEGELAAMKWLQARRDASAK